MLITGNSRINMCGNPNISYVTPDNSNAYPYYPYIPGNFSITGEPNNSNQIDRMFNVTLYIHIHTCIL